MKKVKWSFVKTTQLIYMLVIIFLGICMWHFYLLTPQSEFKQPYMSFVFILLITIGAAFMVTSSILKLFKSVDKENEENRIFLNNRIKSYETQIEECKKSLEKLK
jgi:hypothetical protein